MSIEAMKQALTHEINLVITDPDSKLSGGAQRALQYVHQQIQAIAEAEKQEPDYKALWEQMCQRCDELDAKLAEAEKQEPVAWHEPGAYGNVTTHKDWALANGWLPLYKEKL